MQKKIYILFALFFISSFNLHAQKRGKNQSLINSIDSILNKYNDTIPGFVLTIMKDGIEIYNKAYGFADLEQHIKNNTESVFEAGSVSKQFTATAILILVTESKIKLDDEVHKHIPELPDYGHPIKISHLLTHTSGLKDWRNLTYLTDYPTYAKVYRQEDALNIIYRQKTLNFLPGEKYSYSNSNYDLLAEIVTRVSGEPFIQFVTKRILQPAGMSASSLHENHRNAVKNMSYSYSGKKGSFKQQPLLDETNGAAGLRTTTADLQKWNTAWKENKFGNEVAMLRLQQGVLNNGNKINYTLGGVRIYQVNGLKLITHGGLISSYRALYSWYPDIDLCITYLSNTKDIIVPKVTSLVQKTYGKKAVNPSPDNFLVLNENDKKERIGIYRNTIGHEIAEIEYRKNELYLKNTGELDAIAKDTFIVRGKNPVYSFSKEGLTVTDEEDADFYKKVNRYAPLAGELNDFCGSFFSNDVDSKININVKDGKLQYSRNGNTWFTLRPVYQNGDVKAFRTLSNNILTLFEFSKDKKSINVSVSRASNVVFNKEIN